MTGQIRQFAFVTVNGTPVGAIDKNTHTSPPSTMRLQ
jgi:hypothetical protein